MADDMFGAVTPADVSFEDALACVDRELKMRRQVYPRWVASGKLTQAAADAEVLKMRAVRVGLIKLEAYQQTVGFDVTVVQVMALKLMAKHPEAKS